MNDRMNGEAPRAQAALDALLPEEVARRAEAAGVAKAGRDPVRLFALAVLAGAFIAFGALFSTVAMAGLDGAPNGLTRVVGGLVFSLGLILVLVGGAELFTGDVLMVMAWASRRLGLRTMLRAWTIIYLGNAVGAIGTAVLVFLSGQYALSGGSAGASALRIAAAKAALPFFDAVLLGVLCNVLVCMAVWASLAARSVTDKVLVVILPVAAFVAAGFEHSIANLYLLPLGLLIEGLASASFWQAIARAPADFPALTIANSLRNIAGATLGNVIGGGVLVAAVYWFIYLRPSRD
jgi:formate/nitrite transporter